MIRPVVRAPVVLAHGLFGFERIALGGWTLASYFRGIPEYLRSLGVLVYVPRVHPTAGIERRARKLAERIDTRLPGAHVHIIAHSFGGLDARQLLTLPRWSDRVLSLTTIATPHLGSSLAEAAGRRLGPIYRLLQAFDWDHQGFFDVLPERTRAWHERTLAPETVPCYSVGGAPEPGDVCWLLRKVHAVLERTEGPNDGLVSTASSTAFGTALPSCALDHLRQMNWYTGAARHGVNARVRQLYRQILRVIRAHDIGIAEQTVNQGPLLTGAV